MAGYGRNDEEWDQLTSVGLAFLVERARLEKTTTTGVAEIPIISS